jgi:hypothetical protein
MKFFLDENHLAGKKLNFFCGKYFSFWMPLQNPIFVSVSFGTSIGATTIGIPVISGHSVTRSLGHSVILIIYNWFVY